MNSEPSYDASVLEAMLRQEDAYAAKDYLYQNEVPDAAIKGPLESIEKDRSKMVEWEYQVADFCHFDRETVAIATAYFDRFLSEESSREVLGNTDLFQLAAMTCFYTAAKIHEPESFDPWVLAKMSRGLYTAGQVEKMELVIVKGISWRMNPPTPLAFVREFLAILPDCFLNSDLKPAIYDLCKLQTELAVRTYEFVPVKASTIALAALMNSLESTGMDHIGLGIFKACLAHTLKNAGPLLDVRVDVQNRLYEAVTEFSCVANEASCNTSYPAKQALCGRRSSFNTSPCAVQVISLT